MDVSVIIVNWNTCGLLRECLASIYANTRDPEFEIIVVDNVSTDGSAEMMKAQFPQVILIENSENRGFAAANNQGIAMAQGRYVLLLNSDTLVLNNAVMKTVDFSDSHPECGVVGCRVLNPDRTLQPTCFVFPSLLNMILSSSYLYKLFPKSRFFGRERMTWWNRDDVREVDVVTGCFMLVRQEAIKQVGTMDERFFMYGEETDWCYRFKQANWKVMFAPAGEIVHFGGGSSKQKQSEMTLQLRQSILLFMKKHKSFLTYTLARLLVASFFFLRVPYWLLTAMFARDSKDNDILIARTYLIGACKALLGPKACVKNNMKSNKKRIDTICFGGEDWWYHNRGHIDMQLMRRFARLGTTLYVNSIVMQKPSLKRNAAGGKSFTHKLIRKARSIFRGLRKSDADFWVYSPFSLPVHHIAWLRPLNEVILRLQLRFVARKLGIRNPVIWVACPAACDVALRIKKTKLVYQRTDRYEEYPNVDTDIISQYDLRLKTNADLTVFVNSTLYDEEPDQCRKAILLDHGVDFDMFATAENSEEVPNDIRDIKKPIVGFFGGIDGHTSDIELVKDVVDLLPEMSFVFIGNASADCFGLLAKNNVTMLGQKPYEQIPHYGKLFDVAIMPWRQNRWIEACNPIKLKEYLALGKPIVSTPFAELQKYRDVVYEAKTPEEFADCIKKALVEDNPERIAARRSKVRDASWESKAEQVMNELFGNISDF